ncbi:phosphotransacetylase family protein [Haloferax sp. Q22]|uniref:phosphotransacetylase family protein n=1 Tax=Haloferax sp. (strain Q22) TaxID=1526048 RepID=UPI000737C874|nr:phosphotransacetylase family protein [Haloferax sp. Q22]
MNTVLVTSTGESTGKTAITLALGVLAKERGLDVGYMKPKGTRLQSSTGKTLDEDPMLARELLDIDAEMHQLEPVVYSPTFIQGAVRGKENAEELSEVISHHFEDISAGKDLMLIEGGGSYRTGGIVDLTDGDVANLLDAEVILVADYQHPSDLDDVVAAVEDIGPDRLAGVVFNRVSDASYDELETEVAPFLEARGVPVLGVVPTEKDLAGVTVEELANELGADFATDAPTDAFVERFLVGAMGGDAALRYFRRTKNAAVITGGDRANIQRAALEAPGVKCIILTGGHRPVGAVIGKAEEKGVPVLLVNGDTLSVTDRAEDIVSTGRTRDERTVNRMRDLLYEHADIDAIIGNIEPSGDGAADGDDDDDE